MCWQNVWYFWTHTHTRSPYLVQSSLCQHVPRVARQSCGWTRHQRSPWRDINRRICLKIDKFQQTWGCKRYLPHFHRHEWQQIRHKIRLRLIWMIQCRYDKGDKGVPNLHIRFAEQVKAFKVFGIAAFQVIRCLIDNQLASSWVHQLPDWWAKWKLWPVHRKRRDCASVGWFIH